MKFASVFLLSLVALGYANGAAQSTPSIPPAGEIITPTLDTTQKSNVQGRTFGLIAHVLKTTFNLLFGNYNGGHYGNGGYYNGYPYYSGITGWNGANQFYGAVDNYYTIYSPSINYINNGDGTYTLTIYGINGVQNASTLRLICPANTFRISRSGSGYLCQLQQDASCNVNYI
ncbi:hypothetical protein K502DRAFT_324409, partial [Neoconidiobolus thromboides FSU 785]